MRELDLTLNAKQDHYAVAATFCFHQPLDDAARPKSRRFMLNSANFICQPRQDQFQQAMWRFSCDPDWHIDDHLERLNEHVRKEALRIFGTRSDTPRKPWISQETWSIVRQIAPLRRQICSIRMRLYPARTLFVFRCWSFAARSAAGLTPHSAPHSYNSRIIADQRTLLRSFFFIKYGDAIDAANSVAGYLKAEAVIVATIFTL